MAVVRSIDEACCWLKKNVCSKIQLKLPDEGAGDGGYHYRLATPAVFALYRPGGDRLSPHVPAPVPSVCVELLEGADDLVAGTGRLHLRLSFAAWNPGTFGPDMLPPVEEVAAGIAGEEVSEEPGVRDFGVADDLVRGADGWMDAWNFVDLALRELENSEYIGGLRIVKEEPVLFGPYSEEGETVDRYPYWYAWVSFYAAYGVTRTREQYNQLL